MCGTPFDVTAIFYVEIISIISYNSQVQSQLVFNLIQQVAANAILRNIQPQAAQRTQSLINNHANANLFRANFGPNKIAPMVPSNFIPPQVQQLKPTTVGNPSIVNSMATLSVSSEPVNQQTNLNTTISQQPQPVHEPKPQPTTEPTVRRANLLPNLRNVMGQRNTNIGDRLQMNTLYSDSLGAIHFSLYNLEDFAENKCATNEEHCPKSTKEQNKMIIERICERLESPKLEQKRTTPVDVTHVTDSGDVYCQLHGSEEVQFIKQVIGRLTSGGIQDTYRVQGDNFNEEKLRLVFDPSDGQWYRAIILSTDLPLIDMVPCQFIDYGFVKNIQIEHIYNLEKLSTALSHYPHQTVCVRLNNLTEDDLTPEIVTRLRTMLFGKPVIVKVVIRYEIPLVDVWKRIEGGYLFKINESIRMELELERLVTSTSLVDILLNFFFFHILFY